MNIFRCLDDIRNGPSKSEKGEDVTQTWFVFLVPGHNPAFAQGKSSQLYSYITSLSSKPTY